MQRSVTVSTSTPAAWWSCAAIVVVCLAVGLQTVRNDNYFLGDDFGLVQHLHDLPVERLLSYFVSDWTEGIYGYVLDELRPFLAFSYWLDAHIYGPLNVSGYHITNLMLHLLMPCWCWRLPARSSPESRRFALLAASLFALMPSHAEPMAWISGRVDSLAALFYLGAFLCFVRFRLGNRRRLAVGGAADLHVRVVREAVARDVSSAHPGVRSCSDRRSTDFSGGRWRRDCGRTCRSSCSSVAYLALRQRCSGTPCAKTLLTAEAIEEFFFRQNRYVRELLPAPNGAPRANRLLARSLTVAVLAVCGRWLFARRRACAPRRGAAALLRRSLVLHHDCTHGRDLSLRQASLHHDRRSEHRAGVVDPAGGPGGRAPADEGSNGDGRNGVVLYGRGRDLERVHVGDERHRVAAICLGGPASPAVGSSRQRRARQRARMASGRLVLVLGHAVRAAASVHLRRPVRNVQDRRAPAGLLLPAGSMVGGQEARRDGAAGFAGAAGGDRDCVRAG